MVSFEFSKAMCIHADHDDVYTPMTFACVHTRVRKLIFPVNFERACIHYHTALTYTHSVRKLIFPVNFDRACIHQHSAHTYTHDDHTQNDDEAPLCIHTSSFFNGNIKNGRKQPKQGIEQCNLVESYCNDGGEGWCRL